MLIGDSRILAIESGVLDAYERPGLLGLGFFVLHVGGIRYGVYEPDATLLANSYDEVQRRIADQGRHTAPFAWEKAAKIADSFRTVIYGDEPDGELLGIPSDEFESVIHSNRIVWAPDGDEAFDDGSYVLQFDIPGRVRIVAFRHGEERGHNPETLRDVWMPAEGFYATLLAWKTAFEREWAALPKKRI